MTPTKPNDLYHMPRGEITGRAYRPLWVECLKGFATPFVKYVPNLSQQHELCVCYYDEQFDNDQYKGMPITNGLHGLIQATVKQDPDNPNRLLIVKLVDDWNKVDLTGSDGFINLTV